MAQDYLKINNVIIATPDEGLGYDFETTYSEDTGRVQNGVLHLTPLFTVESFSYSLSNVPAEEVTKILKLVAKGKKFDFHYYSLFYGTWRTDRFYVGKGSISIGRLNASNERVDSFSMNIVGVNPI